MAADAEKTPLPARKAVREDYVSAVHARLQTALSSPTSFAERLVHFWANHFAVSIDKIAILGLAGNFEFEAIRPHIFGRFADLLRASTHHPAMLLYLDQAQSVGPNSQIAQRVGARGKRDIRSQRKSGTRDIGTAHAWRPQRLQPDRCHRICPCNDGANRWRAWPRSIPKADRQCKPGEAVFVEAMHEPGKRTISRSDLCAGRRKGVRRDPVRSLNPSRDRTAHRNKIGAAFCRRPAPGNTGGKA